MRLVSPSDGIIRQVFEITELVEPLRVVDSHGRRARLSRSRHHDDPVRLEEARLVLEGLTRTGGDAGRDLVRGEHGRRTAPPQERGRNRRERPSARKARDSRTGSCSMQSPPIVRMVQPGWEQVWSSGNVDLRRRMERGDWEQRSLFGDFQPRSARSVSGPVGGVAQTSSSCGCQ
jgi:hypothetical protein